MENMHIAFSPPDITDEEIAEVVDTLKSGWITTGPKTKEFEKQIAEYCHTSKAVCLNSATACAEMALRVLDHNSIYLYCFSKRCLSCWRETCPCRCTAEFL